MAPIPSSNVATMRKAGQVVKVQSSLGRIGSSQFDAKARRAFLRCSAAQSANGVMSPERATLELIHAAMVGEITPELAAKKIAADVVQQAPAPAPTALQPNPEFFPEVVYGPNKTPEQIVESLVNITSYQRCVLAIRVEPYIASSVSNLLPDVEYLPESKIMRYRSPIQDSIPRTPKLPGSVAVVFGSQDDLCIAEECRHIAEYMGCYVFKLNGASNVPGFNQLMGNLEAMRAAEVIIAVCGSDGSLPAIIADLVDVPVIAVPTSCGRNSILQGVGPLLGIMSSASPGISSVGVDNSYGAATMVVRILRMAFKLHLARSKAEAAALAAA